MTTLQITPNWKNKTAKFRGTIAAGEHVAVRIINDDGAGDEFIQAGALANLRLRVVNPANGKTLAQFPEPVAEGETPDAWDPTRITPLECELNLNTVQMLMSVPPAANMPLLFVLDAYKGATDEDRGEFTLYFKDYCEVTHWPRRMGEDEPTNLDDYKDIIADFREDIYGDGGFKDRVENAEDAAVAAAAKATAAEASASGANTGAWAAANAAAASSATALQAQSAAETAKADAIDAKAAAVAAQGAAETAQTAAETAQGKAEDAQAAAETAASEAGSAAATAVAGVAEDLADEVTRATEAETALDTAKADKATTLAGYGITDAYTKTETESKISTAVSAEVTARNTAIANAINAVKDSAPEAFDTLKEIADWIGDDQSGAAAMAAQIASHTSQLSQLSQNKVDKESGKRLMTDVEGTKLAGIESGAKNNVLEYANLAAFPATGEANKIYVAKDTNKTYRWETNAYVQIGGGGGGGGGTTDYADLTNKPQIGGVTLSGNKTAADLGLATAAQGAKADTAYQKPQGGIPASDMTQAVQTSLGKANTALQTAPVTRVNNKTGAVVLDASDVGAPSVSELDARVSLGLPFELPEQFLPIEAYVVNSTTNFWLTIDSQSDFIIVEDSQCYYLQYFDKDTSHGYDMDSPDRTIKLAAFDKETLQFDRYHGDAGTITFNGLSPYMGDEVYIVRKEDSDDAIPAIYSTIVAPLASPAFTGTPTAPTPTAGDNSTKVATTEFVRYAMPAAVALVAENDAATLVCADRAVTNATIAAGFSTLNLTFPDAISGKVRDLYLRIVVAAGQSAPALSIPQGITIENPDGVIPEIADGETSAAATTLVWFSETAPGIFTAKSETVKAVA